MTAASWLRPSDVPASGPLTILLSAWHRHRLALVEHVHGRRAVLRDADVVAHGLGALAVSEALVDRLSEHRWPTVTLVLDAGAAPSDVAAACGLDVDELAVGLRSFVERMQRHGAMSDERVAALLALVTT